MNAAPAWLLVFAVVAVGVLHTIVPDHWLPITLIARQRGWTRAETIRAAFVAGVGHVTSTLLIGVVVWLAGVAFAARFGHAVSIASSVALIGFGIWIAVGSWREIRAERDEPEHHSHAHPRNATESRTALLLILGSSPMVEGIPAFFAAGRYGAVLIALMAVAFAASTIATYVVVCVSSQSGLNRLHLGSFEQFGEVASGTLIALVGLVFLFLPVL